MVVNMKIPPKPRTPLVCTAMNACFPLISKFVPRPACPREARSKKSALTAPSSSIRSRFPPMIFWGSSPMRKDGASLPISCTPAVVPSSNRADPPVTTTGYTCATPSTLSISRSFRISSLPNALALIVLLSTIQRSARELVTKAFIALVRKMKMPVCCPIRKILITMPMMMPTLLALSYFMNCHAYLSIS